MPLFPPFIPKKDITIEPTLVKTIGLILAGLLISVAIWQIRFYLYALKNVKGKHIKPRDLLFRTRQAGRRLQMHALLGLAGVGMLIGFYLPVKYAPLMWTLDWLFVLILLFWASLIACVDYISIRLYYMGMERQDRVEQIQHEYELHQAVKKYKNMTQNNDNNSDSEKNSNCSSCSSNNNNSNRSDSNNDDNDNSDGKNDSDSSGNNNKSIDDECDNDKDKIITRQ